MSRNTFFSWLYPNFNNKDDFCICWCSFSKHWKGFQVKKDSLKSRRRALLVNTMNFSSPLLLILFLMFDLLMLKQTAQGSIGLRTISDIALIDSVYFVLRFSHPWLLFVWNSSELVGKFSVRLCLCFSVFTSSFIRLAHSWSLYWLRSLIFSQISRECRYKSRYC